MKKNISCGNDDLIGGYGWSDQGADGHDQGGNDAVSLVTIVFS